VAALASDVTPARFAKPSRGPSENKALAIRFSRVPQPAQKRISFLHAHPRLPSSSTLLVLTQKRFLHPRVAGAILAN